MTEERAKNRANSLMKYVKVPALSYKAVRISEFKWGVGQFYEERQVGIV